MSARKQRTACDSPREIGNRTLDLDLPSFWTTKLTFIIYQLFSVWCVIVAQMSWDQYYNDPRFDFGQGFMWHSLTSISICTSKMILNFWSYLLNTGVSDMHHPAQFIQGQNSEPGLCLCEALYQLSWISSSRLQLYAKRTAMNITFKDHLSL